MESKVLKEIAIIAKDIDENATQLIKTYFASKDIKVDFCNFGDARKKLWQVFKAELSQGVIDLEEIRKQYPQPDLIIKIGKEAPNLNDSIILGVEYAEIHFIKKNSKEISQQDLEQALQNFEDRQRNFGQ